MRRSSERYGETFEIVDQDVRIATLDMADEGAIITSLESKRLLGRPVSLRRLRRLAATCRRSSFSPRSAMDGLLDDCRLYADRIYVASA